ncbi:MAG: ABC transporter substrate-binding protein [Actinomycetota bacterium]
MSQVGQGGVARLLLPVESECLNPYLAACRGAEALTGITLEAPLAVGQSSRYLPMLAEAVPSYEAGTLSLEPFVVEIHLRQGVAFSDGRPLTSRDVEWTYESAARLSERGGLAPLYSGFGRLARVETPDARTARLVFRKPYAAWRDLLTAPVLPEHVYRGRELSGMPLTERMVGSGPFILERREEGIVSFHQNEDYWVEGLPNLDALEVSFPDPREAAEALKSGAAEFGFFSVGGTVPGSGNLLRAEAARTRLEVLVLNPERLGEGEREAILGSLSREQAAYAVGAPVVESLAPNVPARESEAETERGATRLPPELGLVYPSGDPARERVVEALAAQLRAAGVEVEIRAVSPERFFGESLSGDFDIALFGVGTPAEYASLLPVLPSRLEDELIRVLGTVEDGERARLLSDFRRSVTRTGVLVPLFVWPDAYAWSSALSGPRPEVPYRGIAHDVRGWGYFK